MTPDATGAAPTATPAELRQLGLLLKLSGSTAWTSDELLASVAGYRAEFAASGRTPALLKRFERDRQALVDAGIDIETVADPSAPGDRTRWRFRVSADPAAGAVIPLSAEEAMLVDRATQVWEDPQIAGEGRAAFLKAIGAAESGAVADGPRARVQIGTDPAFVPLRRAIAERQQVRLRYRPDGAPAPVPLLVEPVQLVLYQGHWLCSIIDPTTGEDRRLLLSRMTADVEAVGPATRLPDSPKDIPSLLRDTARRTPVVIDAVAGSDAAIRLAHAGTIIESTDDIVRIRVGVWDAGVMADELAGLGGQIRRIESDALPGIEASVRERLQRFRDAHRHPRTPGPRAATANHTPSTDSEQSWDVP